MSITRTWHKRAVALAAAASMLSGATAVQAQDNGGTPAGRSAQAPGEEDFLLLQLQVKNRLMHQELRGYATQDGVCVDLGDMILALDMAVRLDKKSRRATGWLFSEDRTFTLDRDSNTVQIVNTSRPLRPGELIDTPEGWCVNTQSLAGWMGVQLKPNLFNAALVLDSEQPLPFMQALERESRAARLRPERDRSDLSAYPQAPQPYSFWRLPSIDVVASTAFRDGGGSDGLTGRYEVFASGELAKLSYEMRLASDEEAVPDSLRMRAYRKDPEGGLLGPLQATHVAAGDVEVLSGDLAGFSGIGRGAFIGNRALQRPSRFGSTVLRGTLPIGWDAELYRNGQLMAFQQATAEGRYEFEVNLVYGQNELEVVLYGPQGQVRRERQSIPVGYGAVPAGKLEYWAGIIERNRDLIEFSRGPPPTAFRETGWQYAAGIQYGLDRRTVIGASGHSVFLDGERRSYSEVNLQRGLGPLLFNLSAAREIGEGTAYRTDIIGKIGKLNFQVESLVTDGPFVSGLVAENERSSHRLQLDSLLKLGRMPMPVTGGLRRIQLRDGRNVNEVFTRASMITSRLAVTGSILHRNTENDTTREDGTQIGLLANTRIAGITVRGEGTYRLSGDERGLDTLSLVLEKPLDERSDLRLDVEHDARDDQTSFELGYVRQFRHFALQGGAHIATDGVVGANLALSFSFGHDPLSGSVRFSREKLARRGHAAVSVFLDRNGDGLRAPDEEPLEGIEVIAGQRASDEPTDRLGHAFVEGLAPYEKVLVSVDESTLPDPFLMPVGLGQVITPRPGVPAVLQIAVAPTGEVEGVLIGLEGVPLAGAQLELIDGKGQIIGRAMSEYDGFFLFDRIPYGSYDLRLTEKSAAALGADPVLRIGVQLRDGHALDRLGNVRLGEPLAGQAQQAAQPPAGNPGMASAASAQPPHEAVTGTADSAAAGARRDPAQPDPSAEATRQPGQTEGSPAALANPAVPAVASDTTAKPAVAPEPAALAAPANPLPAEISASPSAEGDPGLAVATTPGSANANAAHPAGSEREESVAGAGSLVAQEAARAPAYRDTAAPYRARPAERTARAPSAMNPNAADRASANVSPQTDARAPAALPEQGEHSPASGSQADHSTDLEASREDLAKYDRIVSGKPMPAQHARETGPFRPALPYAISAAGLAIGGIFLFWWRRRKRRHREED